MNTNSTNKNTTFISSSFKQITNNKKHKKRKYKERPREIGKAPRSERSKAARRWVDWRVSDGEKYDVTTFNLKDLEDYQ